MDVPECFRPTRQRTFGETVNADQRLAGRSEKARGGEVNAKIHGKLGKQVWQSNLWKACTSSTGSWNGKAAP